MRSYQGSGLNHSLLDSSTPFAATWPALGIVSSYICHRILFAFPLIQLRFRTTVRQDLKRKFYLQRIGFRLTKFAMGHYSSTTGSQWRPQVIDLAVSPIAARL